MKVYLHNSLIFTTIHTDYTSNRREAFPFVFIQLPLSAAKFTAGRVYIIVKKNGNRKENIIDT